MKRVYINESQLELLNGINKNNDEVTFYEFFVNVKSFLKDLMKNPHETTPSELFSKKGISKDELISKMKDINLITSDEKIDEVVKDGGDGKKVAIHTIQYKIPKNRFKDKIKYLYKDMFIESKKQVFSNSSDMVKDMLEMDYDGAYHNRGGFDKSLVSEEGEGGGATSCGSVMQGGGSNPSAGQYDVPFKNVQKRSFWSPALKRNKDEKNKSISMNRLS